MKKVIGLGFGLLFFVSNAFALDFGIAAKAGINGVGLDLSVGLTKTLNLRLSGAAIDIDDEDESVTVGDDGGEGDIDAELDFDYGANAVLVDWHAFNSNFRFTVGMMKNNGSADISGFLVDDIVVDGQLLLTTDLGEIGGDLDLGDSYQPYVGIGWGRGAGGAGGFSFSADLGVAMLDPDVDLEAASTSPNYTQAELDDLLVSLEKDAEDDLDDLEFWPVFAVGVNYAF
ncbi:MAG: hypothetical protein OER98_12895 [Gammaproteobacteria bacterium]|nr:hypothetical protein [Gammaproteobacteria bacterium]